MKKVLFLLLLSALAWGTTTSAALANDTGWMRKGIRLWYLGGVETGVGVPSNAEEAYTIDAVTGTSARVTHHSALEHWTSPLPPVTQTYSLSDQGPCWIHPLALQNLKVGDAWMGHEITWINRSTYTYATFPYHLLPAKALFDLKSPRQIVKFTYTIEGFLSVGNNAFFDAETGILLYYDAMWEGTNKKFFILAEINYNFARKTAFAEDDGPHTGYLSDVIEQSLGIIGFGGGSVSIKSMVETRYGDIIEMRVSTAITSPDSLPVITDENYCFFGSVPILRRIDADQAANVPPDQWQPFGRYLWWWLPPGVLAGQEINVYDVPMQKTAAAPPTFTATEYPARFFFQTLWFGADGYLTKFASRNPDVWPGDDVFVNLTKVNGLSYYRDVMGRAIPEGEQPGPVPPPGPVIPPPALMPLIAPLLLF
ncbi:MAG TPA: hypothetical protein ENN06_11395 [Desulfobacteraceae bacterium]|nr:hypothetical protein [Desulfobacteraceae bacterium]